MNMQKWLFAVAISVSLLIVAGVISWLTPIGFAPIAIVAGLIFIGIGAFQDGGRADLGFHGASDEPNPWYDEINRKQHEHHQQDVKRGMGNPSLVGKFDVLPAGFITLLIGIVTLFL